MLMQYDIAVGKTLLRPAATVLGMLGVFVFSLGLYPVAGRLVLSRAPIPDSS